MSILIAGRNLSHGWGCIHADSRVSGFRGQLERDFKIETLNDGSICGFTGLFSACLEMPRLLNQYGTLDAIPLAKWPCKNDPEELGGIIITPALDLLIITGRLEFTRSEQYIAASGNVEEYALGIIRGLSKLNPFEDDKLTLRRFNMLARRTIRMCAKDRPGSIGLPVQTLLIKS